MAVFRKHFFQIFWRFFLLFVYFIHFKFWHPQVLKKKIKPGRLPLTQLVNRMAEHQSSSRRFTSKPKQSISVSHPNNVFLFRNCMVKVIKYVDENTLECELYENLEIMFDKPIPSSILGIYRLTDMRYRRICLHQKDLKIRAFMLHFQEYYYVIQLLHSQNEKSI